MTLTKELGRQIKNCKSACHAFDVPRSSFYRHINGVAPQQKTTYSPLALSAEERVSVLDVLHSEKFQDKAPYTVYASLLDEGVYLCSIRTMYRILASNDEVWERRRHTQRPNFPKPELLATAPNQVWSWDITKLKGPAKWTYFYLYVIMDIFSRYVVGWMVAHREQAALATRLIAESCRKQNIQPGQLTVHADRGSSMRSKPVALLLADLGVTKSHNRPYVSNDNPFSESQFKTLKYCPEFPERFGSIEDSRGFCGMFFPWYNEKHKHSGIALVTPSQMHYGLAEKIVSNRAEVLEAAFHETPNRFKGKLPKPAQLPREVWINKPNCEGIVG
jgi:putative transposase